MDLDQNELLRKKIEIGSGITDTEKIDYFWNGYNPFSNCESETRALLLKDDLFKKILDKLFEPRELEDKILKEYYFQLNLIARYILYANESQKAETESAMRRKPSEFSIDMLYCIFYEISQNVRQFELVLL